MHHTIGFFSSLNAQTDAEMVPLVDDVLAIVNAHYFPTMDCDLLAAFAASVNISRARWANPHFRQVVENQIRPISSALLPPTDPNVMDYRSNPLRFIAREEVILQASQPAAAENVHAVAILRWEPPTPMPAGDIYIIRGTSTTACVANAWTTVAATWDSSLPAGRYAIVGCDFVSATGIAGRLILENTVPRPGALAFASVGLRNHYMFLPGGLGVWGYFSSTRMPIPQLFCNAADVAGTFFLAFIRIPGNPGP